MNEPREVEYRRYTDNAGWLGWLPVWMLAVAFVVVVIIGIREEFVKNNPSVKPGAVSLISSWSIRN